MWYRKNKLSLGKAAELAGYNKLDFIERMKIEQEAIFDYSEDENGRGDGRCCKTAMKVIVK